MSKPLFKLLNSCIIYSLVISSAFAQNSSLPLLSISDLEYEGAFRLPADDFGDSNLNYSEGPLAYNPDNDSIFIVGHTYQQAIAEFKIPLIVQSESPANLTLAADPIQNFSLILSRAITGNSQDINRIGGLYYYNNGTSSELLVNAYEYYDAPANNTHCSLAIRNANNLATSSVAGFYTFEGGAGHTTGWMSAIPETWQEDLGGTHITGHSSGIPIISRSSVGPSAFAFDINDFVSDNYSNQIGTTTLLDFSLAGPLNDDLENSNGQNNLWTHLSRAVYGLIVPGTRTYLTLGHSGGHNSGVCYKCTQDNGNLCGGYCAPEANDYYLFYWLWDVNDLVSVKNNQLQSHEVRPYASGIFSTPFSSKELGGGAYDENGNRLFLTFQRADNTQGQYSNPPVVGVYSFLPSSGDPDSGDDDQDEGDEEDSERLELIGKAGKKTVNCVLKDNLTYSRFDKPESTGQLKPTKLAIKFFRKKLQRARIKDQTKRLRKFRISMKRARSCRNGKLFN